MGYKRMSLTPSKFQDECGLHLTFTFLIKFSEVPPSRHGLIPIFAGTVGSVGAPGIFRACMTESCREHKILSFICLPYSFTQEIFIEYLGLPDSGQKNVLLGIALLASFLHPSHNGTHMLTVPKPPPTSATNTTFWTVELLQHLYFFTWGYLWHPWSSLLSTWQHCYFLLTEAVLSINDWQNSVH